MCVGVCMWVRILASTFVHVSVHVSVCVTASECMHANRIHVQYYIHA